MYDKNTRVCAFGCQPPPSCVSISAEAVKPRKVKMKKNNKEKKR